MELLDYTGLSEHKAKYDEQLSGIVADVYDSTSTYSVGEYVIHYENNDNKLYRCITDITEAEEWTVAHWTQVDVTDEIDKTDHNVDLITDAEETYGPSNIVTFESEADGVPIRKITADFSPVQDLHGYDYPWPGGGSKNLFNPSTVTAPGFIKTNGDLNTVGATDWSATDYIKVNEETEYTMSGYLSTSLQACHAFYDSNKEFLSSIQVYTNASSPYYQTFTTPENTAYVRLSIRSETPTNAQFEIGSSATSWVPYSNVCPISGWDECVITGNNVNLLTIDGRTIYSGSNFNGNSIIDLSKPKIFEGYSWMGYYSKSSMLTNIVYSENDSVSFDKGNNNYYGIGFNIPAKANTTYYLGCTNLVGCIGVTFYDGQSKRISTIELKTSGSFITPNKTEYIIVDVLPGEDGPNHISVQNLRIFKGNKDKGYIKHREYQVPVFFIDSQGSSFTAYGGTLTLNEDGSVDLASDYYCGVVQNNLISMSTIGNYIGSFKYFRDVNIPMPSYDTALISDKAEFRAISDADPHDNRSCFFTSYTGGDNAWYRLFVRKDLLSGESADAVNEWLSNNQIMMAYKTRDTKKYHFPSIAQLKSFFGTNNIWTNLNGDTTVTVGKYLSTITSHIDGTKSAILSLIAKDESSGIASTNYVANQFITMNGKFYRIITNVASGAAFVIGTNCVETTVGSQITALLNA